MHRLRKRSPLRTFTVQVARLCYLVPRSRRVRGCELRVCSSRVAHVLISSRSSPYLAASRLKLLHFVSSATLHFVSGMRASSSVLRARGRSDASSADEAAER